MGKKRIIKKEGRRVDRELKTRALSRLPKKKLSSGTLYIDATFNNTKALFADSAGNAIFWTSAGALGFKGAKKGTPFAASQVGNLVGEKAKSIGIKKANVVVKGVGVGRESTIRSFMAHNIELTKIEDRTPIPHNGPTPRKPRRV